MLRSKAWIWMDHHPPTRPRMRIPCHHPKMTPDTFFRDGDPKLMNLQGSYIPREKWGTVDPKYLIFIIENKPGGGGGKSDLCIDPFTQSRQKKKNSNEVDSLDSTLTFFTPCQQSWESNGPTPPMPRFPQRNSRP